MGVKELSDKGPDGTRLGQSTADLVAFWGSTPISQRASASLTSTASLLAMTGASLVANTSTTVSGIFGFNSTMYAELVNALVEIRAALVALGLHKGGA